MTNPERISSTSDIEAAALATQLERELRVCPQCGYRIVHPFVEKCPRCMMTVAIHDPGCHGCLHQRSCPAVQIPPKTP